jgi:HPt (histidine-containing phosphotransfer) domain-containing protein
MGQEQTKATTTENAAGSAERVAQASEVFDFAEATRRIPGGPDAVKEMAQLLLEECPRLMQQIRDGLANQDAAVVGRGAHTLKSAADVFGAKAVVATAFRIEKMGREENLQDVGKEMVELEEEVARLHTALKSLTGPESD